VGKGIPGPQGLSLPRRDVEAPLDDTLVGDGPIFRILSELDVVRHFTKLSQWNFGVDSGMYPLGSCTMKYNPKTNERQASIPGFAGAHPLLPEEPLPGCPGADARPAGTTWAKSPACPPSACSRLPAPRAN
jgi:glycine dehydrogenase subunit 2